MNSNRVAAPATKAWRRVAAAGDSLGLLRPAQRVTPDIDVLIRWRGGGEAAVGASGALLDGMFRVRRSVGPVVS